MRIPSIHVPSDLTQRLYSGLYRPQFGHFGRPCGDEVVWMSCRDEVLRHRTKELFFATDAKHNVMRFMTRIQDILGLEGKNRLTIEETADENIIFVRLSRFWQRVVSRSLVTGLLRAGQHYKPRTSYKVALRKLPYFRYTPHATERFLRGFTKYLPRRFYGWQSTFQDMPQKMVRQYLAKEKRC